MLGESVAVLSLAHFLLLLLNFESAQVLLQLTLVDAMLIFAILELDLRLLLHHSLLVQILEHEMLETLAPDLDRNGVLLLQILMLTVFITEFGLLVLELFLGYEPEVVDSETLVVVLARGNLLFFDETLECSALVSHRLLVLVIVVIVDSVGSCQSFLLCVELFVGSTSFWDHFLGRHTF